MRTELAVGVAVGAVGTVALNAATYLAYGAAAAAAYRIFDR